MFGLGAGAVPSGQLFERSDNLFWYISDYEIWHSTFLSTRDVYNDITFGSQNPRWRVLPKVTNYQHRARGGGQRMPA